MMRKVVFPCPACGWQHDLLLDEPLPQAVECPNCHQNNMLEGRTQIAVTGRCQFCNRPLDDHRGGQCPSKETR